MVDELYLFIITVCTIAFMYFYVVCCSQYKINYILPCVVVPSVLTWSKKPTSQSVVTVSGICWLFHCLCGSGVHWWSRCKKSFWQWQGTCDIYCRQTNSQTR